MTLPSLSPSAERAVDGSSRRNECLRPVPVHAHGMRPMTMTIVTLVAATAFLGGCAGEEHTAAVCDSYDAVQASADDLRNANISENGLSQVRTDLQALRKNLEVLLDDARELYATQVDTVQLAAEQLATTV